MPEFRKKPVVIEAHQNLYASSGEWLADWCGGKFEPRDCSIFISTPEGVMKADLNDWIIKGVKGEFYPCKPDIFEATYEQVEAH